MIATHLGLKPKHIAAQVGALCDEGLVVKVASQPGHQRRSRQRYRSAPQGESPNQDAYLGLSELLLEVLIANRDPQEVGRAAGRLIGKSEASCDSTARPDPITRLRAYLQSRGYQPHQVGSEPRITFILGCCPFEKAAMANPALVCGLHRALAEGMAEALGGSFEVTDLVARDPTTAGCRLQLRTLHTGD